MALTKEDLQAIRAMMQEGMESINGRLDDLENGQQAIRGDIGNLYQNHNKHMAIISEGLGHLNERYAQLESVEQTVNRHEQRIFALEKKASNG